MRLHHHFDISKKNHPVIQLNNRSNEIDEKKAIAHGQLNCTHKKGEESLFKINYFKNLHGKNGKRGLGIK
jgi:hypothetical protein